MDLTPQLNDPLNGRQIEILQLDKDSNIIKQEKFNYSKQILNYHSGFTFYDPLATMRDVLNNSSLIYFRFIRLNAAIIDCAGYKISPDIHDRAYEDVVMKYNRLRMVQYPINAYAVTLSSKETLLQGVSYKETYTYNQKTLQLLGKTLQNRSDDVISYSYLYPNDFNCGIYNTMTNKNMISNVIEEKIYRNNKYWGGRLTEYGSFNNNRIFPANIYLSENTSNQANPSTFTCSGIDKDIFPSKNMAYKEYNSYGKPTHIIENEADNIVYLWSYGGQYPIAEIKNIISYGAVNAAVAAVFGVSGIDTLSALKIVDKTKLNNLRSHPNLMNSLITTYIYEPLVGMLESTDSSGITTYYEYDDFGRLKRAYIKEMNASGVSVEKTISNYDYNYVNK